MPSSAFLFNNIAEMYQFMPYFSVFTQRTAVDAHHQSSAGLVTTGVLHHHVQQGLFNFSQYQLIQVIHILTVQLSKIVLQCLFNRVTQAFELPDPES